MTTGFAAFALLVCSAGPPGEGLSTDRFDEYVLRVQSQRKACGPTAVWYCLRQQGVPADRAELCREAVLGPDGVSLQSLLDVCATSGVRAAAILCESRDVRTLPVPSIVVVDQSHCVVYLGAEADGDLVRYHEPATDRVLIAPRSRVERNWTGEAIVFGSPALSPAIFYSVVAVVAAGTLAGGVGLRGVFRRALNASPVPPAEALL